MRQDRTGQARAGLGREGKGGGMSGATPAGAACQNTSGSYSKYPEASWPDLRQGDKTAGERK